MGFFITADDFGLSEEVNHAIAELIDRNIIRRLGLMVNQDVEFTSDKLRAVETGLHMNFTCKIDHFCQDSQEKRSPLKLLFDFYMGRLDRESILKSMECQFNFFESRGITLSYIDTHQHVHIIPGILDALIQFAKSKGVASIRCLTMDKKYMLSYLYSLVRYGFLLQVPKLVFLYFAGIFMKYRFDRSGIQYSRNLVLMPLACRGNYPGLLKTLVNKFRDTEAEFVTHPGLKRYLNDHDEVDTYDARYIEYMALLNLNSFSRNDLNAQQEVLRNECEQLTLYLTGTRSDNYVCEKYMHAHYADNPAIPLGNASAFDRFLISMALINSMVTGLVDSYSKVFCRSALIRKKMVLLLAILESTEPYCSLFDAVTIGSTTAIIFRLFQKASLFMIRLILSTAIFMPLHLLFKLLAW